MAVSVEVDNSIFCDIDKNVKGEIGMYDLGMMLMWKRFIAHVQKFIC